MERSDHHAYFQERKQTASKLSTDTLTAILCKIMEHMVRDEMMVLLERNKLISKEQNGFVKNKPCLTNLLETIDMVTFALNNGDKTCCIPRLPKSL